MKRKKRDRGFLFTVIWVALATLVIAVFPTEAEASIYEDTLRLHIRARSDSEEDQQIKLEIQDRVLENFTEYTDVCQKSEAEALLNGKIDRIKSAVDGWLSELGCNYGCEVYLCEEWFDTRDYGDFSLPKGVYTALVIELGGGEGENWWCVMYPPMCREVAAGDKIRYTKEESALVYGGKYAVKFKILELVSSLAK